jgi:hypothetical protein
VTPPTDEQRRLMDEYLGRVQALVIEQDWLSPEQLHLVWHLVDHGEPAPGLEQLAWIIAGTGQQVPRSVVTDIRRFTEGLVDPTDLPPDLDSYAT